MRSLRVRLLATVMATVVVFWAGWGAFLGIALWREQRGWRDGLLEGAAQLLLLSLPDTIDRLPEVRAQAVVPKAAYGKYDVAFQIWVDGRNVMHSADAPGPALKPDMRDGYGVSAGRGIAHDEIWRVYSLSGPTGRIHVQTGGPATTWQEKASNAVQLGLFNTAVMLAMLGVAIWWGIRWSFGPVRDVQRAIQHKAAFDFSPLPLLTLPRELRPLVESFNRLLARLSQAVDTERRFIGDAAHELRIPLAALSAQAEVALRADSPADKDAALRRLATGVERSARLSAQLLELARLDAGSRAEQHGPVDLARLVALIASDFDAAAHARRQTVRVAIEPVCVWGDLDEIAIAVRNLIDNALRYGREGGRVEITCDGAVEAGRVRLRIADDGPGVPVDQRERIFERFYRVPGTAQPGSGIGLSLVARIAESHGGAVDVTAGIDGHGLAVILSFPIWLAPERWQD
ncbi:ATP-binding protein [Burkholderia cenocepacia]|uniref:ATP-binding protein n=1 Tax=Burkholderia cenocepacia TaxID=95486 RepID=UPI00222E8BC5|nr:ATP-binding protein [Burkholderia cenocepacia]MCW3607100.1 ATP-binding protein [Burkholderia cenocepacia]MCW5119737.1 ATP-binding protein [Burkholderia cenocepacia]MCW5133660.1 ATP-binding protein [Burkholderia cenocepacia]MCW5175946.1 ATP-binding protein [Burkholderia cenocepacia]MCW5188710.1 ATP-binding protein [Burkholderia cenocepacia]